MKRIDKIIEENWDEDGFIETNDIRLLVKEFMKNAMEQETKEIFDKFRKSAVDEIILWSVEMLDKEEKRWVD